MSDRAMLPASTRKKIERTLDKLISLLDAFDPDPDLESSLGYNPYGSMDQESDDADNEPSLGATHALNQEQAWRAPLVLGTDLEFDGGTASSADSEPSLGAPEQMHALCCNQERWAQGRVDDREDEHDGREPDEDFEPWLAGYPWDGGDDREWDEAERGIGDMDGAMEQYGLSHNGQRVER